MLKLKSVALFLLSFVILVNSFPVDNYEQSSFGRTKCPGKLIPDSRGNCVQTMTPVSNTDQINVRTIFHSKCPRNYIEDPSGNCVTTMKPEIPNDISDIGDLFTTTTEKTTTDTGKGSACQSAPKLILIMFSILPILLLK